MEDEVVELAQTYWQTLATRTSLNADIERQRIEALSLLSRLLSDRSVRGDVVQAYFSQLIELAQSETSDQLRIAILRDAIATGWDRLDDPDSIEPGKTCNAANYYAKLSTTLYGSLIQMTYHNNDHVSWIVVVLLRGSTFCALLLIPNVSPVPASLSVAKVALETLCRIFTPTLSWIVRAGNDEALSAAAKQLFQLFTADDGLIKRIIGTVFESGPQVVQAEHDAIKFACVKFVQVLISAYTPSPNGPLKRNTVHPFLSVDELSKEAKDLMVRIMAAVLEQSSWHSGLVSACLNITVPLAKKHPEAYLQEVFQFLLDLASRWDPKESFSRKNMLKSVKVSLVALLKLRELNVADSQRGVDTLLQKFNAKIDVYQLQPFLPEGVQTRPGREQKSAPAAPSTASTAAAAPTTAAPLNELQVFQTALQKMPGLQPLSMDLRMIPHPWAIQTVLQAMLISGSKLDATGISEWDRMLQTLRNNIATVYSSFGHSMPNLETDQQAPPEPKQAFQFELKPSPVQPDSKKPDQIWDVIKTVFQQVLDAAPAIDNDVSELDVLDATGARAVFDIKRKHLMKNSDDGEEPKEKRIKMDVDGEEETTMETDGKVIEGFSIENVSIKGSKLWWTSVTSRLLSHALRPDMKLDGESTLLVDVFLPWLKNDLAHRWDALVRWLWDEWYLDTKVDKEMYMNRVLQVLKYLWENMEWGTVNEAVFERICIRIPCMPPDVFQSSEVFSFVTILNDTSSELGSKAEVVEEGEVDSEMVAKRLNLALSTLFTITTYHPRTRDQALPQLLTFCFHVSPIVRQHAMKIVEKWWNGALELPKLVGDEADISPVNSVCGLRNGVHTVLFGKVCKFTEEHISKLNEADGNDGSDSWKTLDEDGMRRYLDFFFQVAKKQPSIVAVIFQIFVTLKRDGLDEQMERLTMIVKEKILELHLDGEPGAQFKVVLKNAPEGSESLIMACVKALTEKAWECEGRLPSSVTTAIGELLTQQPERFSNPWYWTYIISGEGLSVEDVQLGIQKIIEGFLEPADDEEVAKANRQVVADSFSRLINGGPLLPRKLQDRLPPILSAADLFTYLHMIEEVVTLRKLVDATNLCFSDPNLSPQFNERVLSNTLQAITTRYNKVPALFMRTIMLTATKHKERVGFIAGTILSNLIQKGIWIPQDDSDEDRAKRVWVGFIKCVQFTEPRSYPLIQRLPKEKYVDMFKTLGAEFRKNYITWATQQPSKTSELMAAVNAAKKIK